MARWLKSFVVGLVLSAPLGSVADQRPHVVFVTGESQYESHYTMPVVAGQLETRHGMRCTLVHDPGREATRPAPGERENSLDGIEVLQDADLAVFYLRHRNLPEEQIAAIEAYLDAGKPVVAFRTSTHAFRYHADDDLATWNDFGQRVLGAAWTTQDSSDNGTLVTVRSDQAGHPILRDVPDSFAMRSWLYEVGPEYPADGAEVLLEGRPAVPGEGPAPEADGHPVAWTYTHPGGGKVFTTTLGHQEDFEADALRTLAVNAIHWALGLETPGTGPRAATGAERRQDFYLEDGDRVVLVGNTLIERMRHFDHLETVLTAAHPGKRLTFRNIGWAGDTVDVQHRPVGFGTIEDQLQELDPTVVFVSYGGNEAFDGPDARDRFLEGYRNILRMIGRFTDRVVVLTPVAHDPKASPAADVEAHNEALAWFSEGIRGLAAEEGHWSVDLFSLFRNLAEDPNSPAYTSNGIHLNDYGDRMLANGIRTALGIPGYSWSLDYSLEGGPEGLPQFSVAVQEGKLLHLDAGHESVQFHFLPERFPMDALGRGAITVKGMRGGRYEVRENNRPVGEAALPEGAGAVLLRQPGDASPEYEALRESILQKNEYWWFRWRAHNGEYIYGRRARTGRGNAGNPQFATEHAEFERLVAETEAAIHALARPEPRTYTLRWMGEE